ncbi:hypothetical protein ACFWVT_11035 [Streptomyces cyaneofuscatus]|uniref:hypothetical protein n=1 Tax=Streptomyces cyaneofuscatus TaxID=66883 RepID=UPI003662CCD8
MHHTPRPCSVIVGLGSHDLGVADAAAGFYLRGPAPVIVSASSPMTFAEYAASIGYDRMVIDMLVGALQRLLVHPAQGFLIEQPVPDEVTAAYERLVGAGFTSRLIP